MPSFKDAHGREWLVTFDGLLLADVRDECKVDLCDYSAAGYLQVQNDEALLTRVLCVLLKEQIDGLRMRPKHFANALRGEVFEAAQAAVWGAAADFFPPKKWSAMRSALNRMLASQEYLASIREVVSLANLPGMPPTVREGILMEAYSQLRAASTDSPKSAGEASVGGSTDAEPLTPAFTAPESSESVHAA